jgi:hypothetical protein
MYVYISHDMQFPAIDYRQLVFRVAHDSARETRIWAGEAKKR